MKEVEGDIYSKFKELGIDKDTRIAKMLQLKYSKEPEKAMMELYAKIKNKTTLTTEALQRMVYDLMDKYETPKIIKFHKKDIEEYD